MKITTDSISADRNGKATLLLTIFENWMHLFQYLKLTFAGTYQSVSLKITPHSKIQGSKDLFVFDKNSEKKR